MHVGLEFRLDLQCFSIEDFAILGPAIESAERPDGNNAKKNRITTTEQKEEINLWTVIHLKKQIYFR